VCGQFDFYENWRRWVWTSNFTDYISESRPIAAFFQPRNKFRKAEDLNQAPDTVELSAGSQGEISELHAVPVDISAEGEDPTETAVDSESDDDDLDVLGPPA